MSEAAPVTGTRTEQFQTPFVVRCNWWLGVAAIIIGPLLVAAPFFLFGDDSFTDLYPTIGGTAVVMAFIVLTWPQRFVIEPDCVRIKGPFNYTKRKYQIAGLADLVLDGRTLRRRSDGKKLYKLDIIECNPQDLQTLRNSIPAA